MDKTNPLDTLRDIRLPPPPAGLPDWVLLALAAFAFLSAVLLVLALLRRFRPDRRALFQRIDEALRLPDDAAVAQLAHVLRDEALHSAGPAAAQLTGDAWLGWLDRRYATRFFSEGAGQAFGDALYGRGTDIDAGRLAAGVRRVLAGAMVAAMVSFGWPFAFLLLPLPLLLAFARNRTLATAPLRVPPALAAAMDASGTAAQRTGWRLILPALAWIALVTGIAQPGLISGQQVVPASGRALELVVDLSGSMEKRDFVIDGQATDRLSAVKAVASAFVEARQGDRVGLVLFGDEAFSASPVSFDRASVSHALGESAIGMAGRTTAIGEALGLAIVKLRDDPAPERAIILLSDGTNNSGSAEPEDAARLARDNGIRIHSIGLGSERMDGAGDPIDPSADLDEKTLREVADASGGTFFRARTTDELKAAYEAIDALEGGKAPAPPFVPRHDLTGYAITAMIALLGLALALSWREDRA